MTGKTHRVGGVLSCLIGFTYLQSKGYLLPEIEEPLQLIVMYPFALYGSIVSDMDHSWESAPSKDLISYCIWKILHLSTPIRKWFNSGGAFKKKIHKYLKWLFGVFDSKHRSWQTHSDLFLILSVFLMNWLLISSTDLGGVVMTLVFGGLLLGIISHLILDMLTPDGIWSILFAPLNFVKSFLLKSKGKTYLVKISLVPKSSFFSVGGNDGKETLWEKVIRKMMWFASVVLLLYQIYLLQPYRIYIW